MASKAENPFSKARKIRDLDDALKRSFTNIKDDMTALKEGMHQQGVKLAELKQDTKDSRADFVTVDKFNIVKIKIGELNENMKKVWDIEKKLEDLDRKAVSDSEFEKQSVALNNEIAKLKEDIKDINDVLTTEEQTKNLVTDINEEFDNVKQSIEELRSIKDAITKEELDKRTEKLEKKAKEVRTDFDKVKSEVKSKINTVQVEALVADINSEFDKVKDMIANIRTGESRFALSDNMETEINKLDERFKEFSQDITTALDEFSKGVERSFSDLSKAAEKKHTQIEKEIGKVEDRLSKKDADLKEKFSDDMSKVRKDMKILVSRKQAEKLVNDLNKEFDNVKADIDSNSKDLALLAKGSATKKELASEVEKLKKDLLKMSKDITKLRKESATKDETYSFVDELKERLSETNKAVKDMFNDLVKRIKKESDDSTKRSKANSQDIGSVDKSLRKELKSKVEEDDLHDELDVVRDEFEKMHKDLKDIRSRMLEQSDLNTLNKTVKNMAAQQKKDYASRKQFERLASAVERLEDQVDAQSSMLKDKQKEIRAYAKELKAAKKAEKRLARYESVVAKSGSKPKKAVKKKKVADGEYRKSSFLASFLIGAAFVILIGAVVFFFAGLTSVTDTLSIAAVACFVVGIIIRIVVAFKRNGDQ